MSERVRIGLVGCGGMSGAHMNAYKALWEKNVRQFEIIAACDIEESRAKKRAEEAQAFQGGPPPSVYKELEAMLKNEKNLEAADICSLHRNHHTLAIPCLEAKKHVIIEKPLGITMRTCRLMIEAAQKNNCVFAVAENYRRSPAERATNWAIRKGMIGDIRMFFWQDAGEGLGKWSWRNFKDQAGGGWVLDGGVHFTDLFRYHIGAEAEEIYAVTKQYEPYRYDEPKERKGGIKVTVEDASMAIIKFPKEVLVQWIWAGTAPGNGFNRRTLYGSEGCIDWGSGFWNRKGENTDRQTLAQQFMQSLSDEEKDRLFPRGVTNSEAVELDDFADAILKGTKVEVDGIDGMRSEAICMGVFESSWLGAPVKIKDIEDCKIEGYQKEINEDLGL